MLGVDTEFNLIGLSISGADRELIHETIRAIDCTRHPSGFQPQINDPVRGPVIVLVLVVWRLVISGKSVHLVRDRTGRLERGTERPTRQMEVDRGSGYSLCRRADPDRPRCPADPEQRYTD